MAKSLAEIPAVEWSGDDIWSGRFPYLQAAAAQKYGPILRWSINEGYEQGDFVFLVGPEANRFVFHSGREHFSHDQGWTPLIGDTLGKGLLNMDDPVHGRHRKMWNPAFAATAIEAYLPVIHRVIVERTRDWPDSPVVDILRETREITFDAAAGALAGFEIGPRVDHLREMFYILLHGFDENSQSFDEYIESAYRAQTELFSTLAVLIAERRRMPDDQQPRDVLGMIVRARDENGDALSDEQVLAHLNILLVAGHETTTTLGSWALLMLARHPEWAERIRAELSELPGSRDEPLRPDALRGMRLLDNFIKETGRLYSPVINVPRGVLSDFEFGGYIVPAGTPVRLALAASHRLPNIFADPESFDPDRYASPREEDKKISYSLVTFGGGSRICIGVNFANIEVKALVAHVLSHYSLETVQSGLPSHAGHWNAMIPDGISLRVKPLASA